jgi:ribonuclease P protein component
LLCFQESHDEKNLPTKPPQAGADARVSRAHVDPKRTQGSAVAPSQRASPADTLIRNDDEGSVGRRLPLGSRLRRPADYRRVFDKPFRSTDPYFVVLARPDEEHPARLGLAIAKKCAGRAVQRNRIKRIVRESFRHNRLVLKGVDCVVLCRQRAVGATNRQLFDSLATHWLRIRDLLCDGS